MRLQGACTLLLVLAVPAVAAATEFTDFRIPAHSWRESTYGISGNLQSQSLSEWPRASRNSAYNGNVGLGFFWWHDSDTWQWGAGVNGFADGRRSRHDEESYTQSPDPGPADFTSFDRQRNREAAGRERWSAEVRLRGYPHAGPWGFEVGGSASGYYGQRWQTGDMVFESSTLGNSFRTESQNHGVSWEYRETARLGVVAGRGRVRDATGVFRAMLLAERLERDHALARPVSAAGLQKLAQLYYVRPELGAVHALPDKFFWEEVERVLREDGALADSGFSARGLIHAEEELVVANGYFQRPVGWFVGPAVSAEHSHVLNRLDGTQGTRSYQDGVLQFENLTATSVSQTQFADAIWVGAQGEYHAALDARTQFDVFERGLVDFKQDPEGVQFQGNFSLSRLIAERWFGRLAASHLRGLQADPAQSAWLVNAGATVGYFLEDFCRIELAGNRTQQHSQFTPGTPFSALTYGVSLQLTVGRGRLDAPGLMSAQRPLN